MKISYTVAGAVLGGLIVLLIVTVGFYNTLLVAAGAGVGYLIGYVLQAGGVEIRLNRRSTA